MDYQDLVGLILSPADNRSELSKTIDEIAEEEYRKELGVAVITNAYDRPRRPRGRPTAVTKEVLRDLRMGFMMGYSDNECIAFAGLTRSVFYDYKAKNAEFADYVEQWKEAPILKAKRTLYQSLNNQDAAQWYLERKLRGEFALRKELTGPDGGSIGIALDRIETDYGTIADKAREHLGPAIEGQMVENDPPVQNQD